MMSLRSLRNIDRRLALSVLILIVSTGILAIGLVSIISALLGGGVDLPAQGSISDLVSQSTGGSAPASDHPSGPPPPAPVRFVIPRLYVDAPVIPEGLTADGHPGVPDRPDQVAWYPFTAAPGQSSNAVFSGHVDWQTRTGEPIPGVFYRLREMKIGDIIEIALENGARLQYRVTGNVATPYNDPNVAKVMESTNRDVITIITCGGTWVRDRSADFGGNYSHRVIVRAERVQGLASESTGSSGAGG